MRIVGGKYRHRLIDWPGDMNITRPTKDRIREAIFSAVSNIEGFSSLDLYAGSGAMGIESLSRGCSYAAFVDASSLAIACIQKNLSSLNVMKNEYGLFGMSDVAAIKKFANENYKFDLVFLDPPYKEGKYYEIIDLLNENDLLTNNAIIVCEGDHPLEFDESKYNKIKEYKYGEIYVYILWR